MRNGCIIRFFVCTYKSVCMSKIVHMYWRCFDSLLLCSFTMQVPQTVIISEIHICLANSIKDLSLSCNICVKYFYLNCLLIFCKAFLFIWYLCNVFKGLKVYVLFYEHAKPIHSLFILFSEQIFSAITSRVIFNFVSSSLLI